MNRAEQEEVLRVAVDLPYEKARPAVASRYRPDPRSPLAAQLEMALEDGYKRLLSLSLEREVRAALTEKAEAHAISLFAANLRNLLLQPPLKGQRVMGIDPGFRTGCKVAVVDPTGKYLEGATIYPHPAPEAVGRGQGHRPRPGGQARGVPWWPWATAPPPGRRRRWWPR